MNRNEHLTFPQSLEQEWSARGYYGTLRHNAKSIYQRYVGWYDANPANLNPLPPTQRGARLVEYMGGESAVIAKAKEDFDRGDYRWVAEIMSEVVFANPGNQQARDLGADAMEQLGYQAESATWRNAYLQGASELREPVVTGEAGAPVGPDVVRALTVPLFFDFLAVRINGPAAAGKRIVVNWTFRDIGEEYALTLQNAALTYSPRLTDDADVSLTLARSTLDDLVMKRHSLQELIDRDSVALVGDSKKIHELFMLLDDFRFLFPIVEPNPVVDQIATEGAEADSP